MLAFSSARRALLCTISFQRALADHNQEHADRPVQVDMGMHTGEAIRESNDFKGKLLS